LKLQTKIKKIVQKMAVAYKDWPEMLSSTLHEYCTSVHISTVATPLLPSVYNMEFVLSVEVEVPSIRVLLESKLDQI
jgi:hypothetical protein